MRSGKDDKQMMCTCVDNMQMIWCYIGIDLDLSKPKGMPGLKLHSALA